MLAKEWGQEGKKTQMQQSIATECETTPQKLHVPLSAEQHVAAESTPW